MKRVLDKKEIVEQGEEDAFTGGSRNVETIFTNNWSLQNMREEAF